MSSRRGNGRENRVRDYYADAGWFAICGRASRGPADVVACKAGVIHLTQVKSDKKSPYAHFGPEDRRVLIETAEQAGGTAHLAWWPPFSKLPTFIPWHEWPAVKEARMTKPSQSTRVLTELARRRDHGLTQNDWLVPGGMDGRGRITRVPRCINDLRNEGHAIVENGWRDGFKVYRLVLEASSTPAQDRVEDAAETLFDAPAAKPASSHWRDAA